MPNRDDMMRLPFDPIVRAVRADTERRREDEKRVPTVQRDPKLVAFETQRHEVGGSFDEVVREYIRLAASNHMETWREKFLNVEVTFGFGDSTAAAIIAWSAKSLPEIADVKPRGWLPMPEDLNDLRGLKIRWVKLATGVVNSTVFDDVASEKIVTRLLDGRTPRGRIVAYSTDWECPND